MRQLSFTGLVTILKFSEVQISTLWGHKSDIGEEVVSLYNQYAKQPLTQQFRYIQKSF